MQAEQPIVLKRDCEAVMVPSGEKVTLVSGSSVWVTQSLGGSCTVMTDRGYMVRIEEKDAQALGLPTSLEQKNAGAPVTSQSGAIEQQVWDQLKSCFDPEIPVNIVDLGLVYRCAVEPLSSGGHRADVQFTLTARGCGMGEALKGDIRRKVLSVTGIREVNVELVWEPPWSQSRLSEKAKQQLGIS